MSRLLSDWHCGTAIAAEHVFHIDEVRRQDSQCVLSHSSEKCYAAMPWQVLRYTLWQDGGPPGYSQIFSVSRLWSILVTGLVFSQQIWLSMRSNKWSVAVTQLMDVAVEILWMATVPLAEMDTSLGMIEWLGGQGITWHQVASLISPLLWLESLVERSARSMEGLGASQNHGKCGKRIITVFFKGPLLPFTVHSCSVWAGPKESL